MSSHRWHLGGQAEPLGRTLWMSNLALSGSMKVSGLGMTEATLHAL